MNTDSDTSKGDAMAVETPSVPRSRGRTERSEQAGAGAPERTWSEWVRELGTDKAVARGACVMAKMEWDAPVRKQQFLDAVAAFGQRRHGTR